MEPADSGIFFTSHDVEFNLPQEPSIRNWIIDAIHSEAKDLHRIDFIFCSDDYLLEINRTHLQHDYYTDILTFPLAADPILAEIYISIDRVKENATSLGVDFDMELRRVMIHGVLHLCGYDDHEEADIRGMREKEEEWLKKWG